MRLTSTALRRAAAIGALAPVAVFAAACSSGSTSAQKPSTRTVTVTATPGSSQGSGSSSSPTSSPSPTGPGDCATSALHVSTGQSQGAAGTIYTSIDFKNVAGSPCILRGYPGVSLVTAGSSAGHQIGAAARRDPATPVTAITLAPGQVAHATLGVSQAGNYPATTCHPVTAHWLKVFPPNQYAAVYLPFTTQTCSLASQKTMIIRAMSSGA